METFFLFRRNNMKSGGDNASGQQCREKMSGSEKKSDREHVRHFLHEKVSGRFTV